MINIEITQDPRTNILKRWTARASRVSEKTGQEHEVWLKRFYSRAQAVRYVADWNLNMNPEFIQLRDAYHLAVQEIRTRLEEEASAAAPAGDGE